MSKGWLIAREAYPNLLAHTPLGWAWSGFRIAGKTAYKFWRAVSKSLNDAWTALSDMEQEVDYRRGTQFFGEWENALSLPDPCLPKTKTAADRRRQIAFRLNKKRWSTAQDWKDLAALFGLTIDVTPGWLVQKTSLFWVGPDSDEQHPQFPIPFWDFPKLGRFRVYVDVLGYDFWGFEYGEGATPGFPIPFGQVDELLEDFKCLIERVKPANVIIIWNDNPLRNGCYGETFEETFNETFC